MVVCQGPNEANKWVELLTSVDIKKNQDTVVKRLGSINPPTPPPHVSTSLFFFKILLVLYLYFLCNLKTPISYTVNRKALSTPLPMLLPTPADALSKKLTASTDAL